MIELFRDELKPYVSNERSITQHSSKRTYICNLILQDKVIHDVAKFMGHSNAARERYYAKLDMSRKLKGHNSNRIWIKGRKDYCT